MHKRHANEDMTCKNLVHTKYTRTHTRAYRHNKKIAYAHWRYRKFCKSIVHNFEMYTALGGITPEIKLRIVVELDIRARAVLAKHQSYSAFKDNQWRPALECRMPAFADFKTFLADCSVHHGRFCRCVTSVCRRRIV